LVELNVREQCLNVLKTPLVQRHIRKFGFPRVHGLVPPFHSDEHFVCRRPQILFPTIFIPTRFQVYELSEGLLKELNIDFESYIEEYQHIYAVGRSNASKAADPPRAPTAGSQPQDQSAQSPQGQHSGSRWEPPMDGLRKL
jgi:hypothetical protein